MTSSTAVRRITLFKVPEEDGQRKMIEAFRKMNKDQKKNGKSYILKCEVGQAHDEPRSRGYTVASILSFASMADMKYYETECAAHTALQKTAVGLVTERPVVMVLEGETEIKN